ncbi:MAG: recombinase family protein [Clostridia bacterium]|nr:recombinase family protein [Clostridia bacterium]
MNNNELKVACAYIRVSTDDQIEYSPDSQLKNIRNYAKTHGYIVPDEFIFIDEGISGKNTKKRPAFNKMIGTAKLKPKPFDAILLWKFSRFARNREDSIVYKSMLRKQLGIDVISVSETIGDDKMSILFEAMIEAMDEYYSINLAEEVKRGMLEKISRGEAVTVAPFGYKMVDKKLVIDPYTSSIVQMIFNDFLANGNKTTIARKLNNLGIKTIRGNNWDNRGIEYVLNNPVYIGKLRWTPTGKTRRNYHNPDTLTVDGEHQPIISEKMFEETQQKLSDIRNSYKPYARQSPATFMLRGLLRCSNCGATLVMSSNKKYLQCHNYSKGKCLVSHSISIARVSEVVLNTIVSAFATGDFELRTDVKSNTDENDFIDYDELISKEKTKLQRAKNAYEQGVYTLEEYAESKKTIMSHIEHLETQKPKNENVSMLELKKKFVRKHTPTLEKLKSSDLSEQEKNDLLHTFVDNIIFKRSDGTFQLIFHM